MAAGVEYTIDELARAAGTTVRSLRVYHERGVLPPPQVKGRTGYYSPEHLNRVHTISRLLDRGIKLNGIKELLKAWDRGDDLGDILGVGTLLSGADPDEPPVGGTEAGEDTIPATELQERYAVVPNGLARIVASGLYEPVDAATYRPADKQMIRFAEQLAAAGIPDAEVLGELERIRSDCDRIARRFVDLFQRTVWQEYQDSERTADDLAKLTGQLQLARNLPGRAASELVTRFVGQYIAADSELADLPTDA
ncbi:MerR family transcriptional regulator [Nocardia flavorosea]|uniref:MerR family transcriptional regulator n=1 Tax=Nocardia flavorosea TaxID=53429 RepID=A0A846YJQ7_9NOCA|nr:MerR family transcriptional regulator [Nocardia flavorosea]NKY59846.1 MerR family transcriptional regulator [Nocardia flavorosea]